MNKNQVVNKSLHVIEQAGLLIILIATMIAIGQEIMVMVRQREVTLTDLLLMFIYLEVIAMIKIYYQEHRLPIRFPLYIAIVALARYIILDSKSLEQWQLLETAITIVLLTFAILTVRFGHFTYPYQATREDDPCKEEKGANRTSKDSG